MRSPFSTPWLTCIQPHPGAAIRLFCFPYAGGGASIFHAWSKKLAERIEVCAVRLPGRENRITEPPFTQIAPLINALMPALTPYLNKPFAFFGHSMGALVAFELTRRLRRQNVGRPRRLFVSARHAPHFPEPSPPLYALPDAQFLAQLRRLNGVPEQVLQHDELMQLIMPTLRSDFTVCDTYAYSDEPPLECPITALYGEEDDRAGRDALAAWEDQTSAAFSLRMFPGAHFFLHTAEQLLLQTLDQELRSALLDTQT